MTYLDSEPGVFRRSPEVGLECGVNGAGDCSCKNAPKKTAK